MKVLDCGILTVTERRLIIQYIIKLDIQGVAVTVESAYIGFIFTKTNDLVGADIGIEDGVHVFFAIGLFHLCSKGIPVVG